MNKKSKLVEDFLKMWHHPGGWRQAVEKYFHENAVYENIGMSRSEGKEAILDFVTHFENATNGGWMVAEDAMIAEIGDLVLTERIDRIVDGNGNVFMSTPVMGAFQVDGDLIVAWRDYFDTGSLQAPYDGPGSIMTPVT